MTTPADWYPDPENPGQLRYWDGTLWTEHRAPAPGAAAEPESAPVPDEGPASEQATSIVSLPQTPAPDAEPKLPPDGGAHRAADAPAEPASPSYDQTVATPTWDPPPGMSYGAPVATPPSSNPPPTGPPPSTPSWGAPPPGQPYQPPPDQSWGTAPGGQSYGAPQFAPPPGPPPGPPNGGPNKKLLIGILSGAAALILILALVLVYVFVIRDDGTTVIASPSTSSSASSSSSRTQETVSSTTETTESETTETESPNRGSAGPVTDGNLTFTINDIEAADSVTSTFSDMVGKDAQGTYAIVRLTVGNIGTEPVTFLATFQRLNGSGQSLVPDDEATVFAGGGFADVPPGAQVDTVVVFDVPDDVEPESMFFQENPVTPGVELPF